MAHIVTKLRIGLACRSAGADAARADTLDNRTVGALLDGLLDFAASEGVTMSAREAVGHLVNQLRLELHAKGELDNFLGALRQRCAVRGHGECVAMASLLDERCAQAASDRMRTLTNAKLKRPAVATAAGRLVERAKRELAALQALRKAHGLHQPPPPDRKIDATLAALRAQLPEVAGEADLLLETVSLLSEEWNRVAMRRAGLVEAAREERAAPPMIDRKHSAPAQPAPVEVAAPAHRLEQPVQPVQPDAVRYVHLRPLPQATDIVRLYKRYPGEKSPWQECVNRVVSPVLLPMRDWPAADLPDKPERSWHEDLAECVRLAFATPDRPVGGAMLHNLLGKLSNNLTLHKGGDPRLDDSIVDVLTTELFRVSMAAPPDQQAAQAAQRMGSLMDALFPPQPSVEMLAQGLEQLLDSMRRVRITQAISPDCLAAMMAEVVRRTGGATMPTEVLRLVLQPVFWGGLASDKPGQVLRAVVDEWCRAAPGQPAQERFFGALLDCYQDLEGIADEQAFELLQSALESVLWLNPPPSPGDTSGRAGATLAAVRRNVTTHILHLHHREPDHLGRLLKHWGRVCERQDASNARVMAQRKPATPSAAAAGARADVDPMPGIIALTLDRLLDSDQVERFAINRRPVAQGTWRGWSSAADFEAALALAAVFEMAERSPQSGALVASLRQRFGEAIPALPADRVQELAMTWSGAQLQRKVKPAEALKELLNLFRPGRQEGAPPLVEQLDAPRTAALARGFMRAWVSGGDSDPADARQRDGRALLDELAPELASMPPWKMSAVALGIRGVAPPAGPSGTPKDARQWAWLAWASVDLSDPQMLDAALHEVIVENLPARDKRNLVAMLTSDHLMDLTDNAFKTVLRFIVSQSLEPTPAKGQARLLAFCRNLRDHTGLGFVRDGKAGHMPLWVLEENEERMKRAFGRVRQVLAELEPSQAARELTDFSRRLEEALEQVPPPPPPAESERPGGPAPGSDPLVRALDFRLAGWGEREEPERKDSEGKAAPVALLAKTMTAPRLSNRDESAAAHLERVQREHAAALLGANPTVTAQSSTSSSS